MRSQEQVSQIERSRSGAIAGVLFFALLIASPDPNSPGEAVSAVTAKEFFLANQTNFELMLLMVGLGYGFFVWFVVALTSELRRAEGGEGRLSMLAFGAGLLVAGFYVIGTAFTAIPGLSVSAETDPERVQTLALIGNEALDVLVKASTFWRGLLMGAVSILILVRRPLPTWLGWVGAILAAAALVGSIGFLESPVQDAMVALGFGSFIAFHFWVLLTSVVMLFRRQRVPIQPR